MKNIVHVGSGILTIPPEKGGAVEMIIYETCIFAAGRGYDPIILDNAPPRTERGVKIHSVAAPRLPGVFLLRLTEFIFGVKSLLEIRKLLRNGGIVHTHTVFTALPIALLRKVLPKVKFVYTSHNPAWTDENLDIFNLVIRKFEKLVVRKADMVTIGSNQARKMLIKKSGIDSRKARTVYNFVDMKRFRPQKARSTVPTVLFVGKLIQNKGVEYLLKAVPLVRKHIDNVQFVIAGPASFESGKDNPWKRLAEELGIKDNVAFTGAASHEELPHIYAAADVFCFPTIRETFGVVLAEAMASGLPVVSSDIPVVKEVVDVAGILVPRRDHEAVADAVVKILTDKKLAGKLGKAAIKRARLFDKKKVLEGYIKIYREIW